MTGVRTAAAYVTLAPAERVVLGAALFGIGWGLAGLCPGPAVTGLITAKAPLYAFVAAMIAGFILHDAAGGLASGQSANSIQ